MEFVLNGNIFMSHDFGAETDVETEIKISLYVENFQSSRMHRLEEL